MGVERLLVPLLASDRCSGLRWLACSDISHNGLMTLTRALAANSSLQTLKLGCNTIHQRSATMLVDALEGHASLTHLTLEHNPICDAGAGDCASGTIAKYYALCGCGDAAAAAS